MGGQPGRIILALGVCQLPVYLELVGFILFTSCIQKGCPGQTPYPLTTCPQAGRRGGGCQGDLPFYCSLLSIREEKSWPEVPAPTTFFSFSLATIGPVLTLSQQ